MEERMLDVAQAAKRLGVCEETIRRRIRKGLIVAVEVGAGGSRKTYRIPEAHLESARRTPEEGLEVISRDDS